MILQEIKDIVQECEEAKREELFSEYARKQAELSAYEKIRELLGVKENV